MLDVLIITDSKHASQAARLKKGRYPKAKVVQVQSGDEFFNELEKDRCTPILVLVLDGDDTGKIEIDGKPVTVRGRSDLELSVGDEIVLEGDADKALRPSEEDALKSLGAGAVHDNRVVLDPLPQPPQVAVEVDPGDARTRGVKSSLGSAGKTHFVTVKGEGRVVLRAKLVTNDTAENRKATTWEAGRGTQLTVSGSDPLVVSLSRGTEKKAELWIKFRGTRIVELVVWVVWCDLSAHLPPAYTGASPLDGETLGKEAQRVGAPPGYRVRGSIDWHFAIKPPAIISDPDRPALESQGQVPVPGAGVLPTPFFGWELATDTRVKTSEVFGNGPVVVTRRDEYSWPGGDAEGNSLAAARSNPYAPPFDPAWPSRWEAPFPDSYGRDGLIAGFHQQARIFVRVQLDDTWYRCSNKQPYRLRASAKKPSTGPWKGKWRAEPGTQPVLELNNSNW